jgi:disulfide bond formation protein DsbB
MMMMMMMMIIIIIIIIIINMTVMTTVIIIIIIIIIAIRGISHTSKVLPSENKPEWWVAQFAEEDIYQEKNLRLGEMVVVVMKMTIIQS